MSTVAKIRRRDRILSSPPEGLRQDWTEWQVVVGRKIVARCGTERMAEDRAKELGLIVQKQSER